MLPLHFALLFLTAIFLLLFAIVYLKFEFDYKKNSDLKMYTSFVNTLPYGVIFSDRNFNIVLSNSNARFLLKIDQELIKTNKNLISLFSHCNKKELVEKAFTQALIKKNSINVYGVTLDNNKVFDLVVSSIYSEFGVSGLTLLLVDKSKENSKAEKKDDFMAMVVHELRSPLTVISGTSQLLMDKWQQLNDEQRGTSLFHIKNSSASLLKLVNDLLDSSKIESGKFIVTKNLGDINQLLQQESSYYLNLASEKNISLRLDLNMSINKFNFDYEKIVQLMNNLLSNAIKFTHEGEIVIKSDLQHSSVIISVTDTGIGIPADQVDKMFDKYTQLESSSRSHDKGTGLGLNISKGIVEAHGGSLWYERNQPSGSKFVFTLPL